MKRQLIIKGTLVVGLVLFLMSCTSQKYARKCNGKRGVKTNMGVL